MLKENKAPLRISDISRLADLHGEIRWDVTDKDGLVAKNIYNYRHLNGKTYIRKEEGEEDVE